MSLRAVYLIASILCFIFAVLHSVDYLPAFENQPLSVGVLLLLADACMRWHKESKP